LHFIGGGGWNVTRRRRNALRKSRKLLVEHLEQRRVLDAQLGAFGGAVLLDASDRVTEENAAVSASAELALAEGESDGWRTFETFEQLEAFLAEDAEQRWGHLFGEKVWHDPWFYRHVDDGMMFETATVRPTSADLRNVADYSQTNVQVAGVDEGDIVETDGRYLYLNGDRQVVIVDTASDSGLQVVSRVDVEGRPQAIYLADNRLSIISRPSYGYPGPVPMLNDALWRGPWDAESLFVVTVVDISNPAEPQSISEIRIEGDLIDSRMIGDTLYLVSGDSFYLPAPEVTCSPTMDSPGPVESIDPVGLAGDVFVVAMPSFIAPHGGSCVYETREEYWQRLGDDWLDLALPSFAARDAGGDVLAAGWLTEPENTYRPLTDNAQRLVSVSAVDVSAALPTIEASIAAPLDWTSTLYVSPESLYVVAPTFDMPLETPGSSIYKFSLGQEIDLAAAGRVPGRVLNQFSLDEFEGRLRIVTQQGWNANATSGLYVLEQAGEALNIVGRVEDLAPGERLYSVRFMGDQAFVVTFGPTNGAWYDPLFTIDLSEPTSPQVRGELEIPGFSNYLQLIDDDFLIGLGRNADETNGRSLEPQVSLFDVADFDDPQLEARLSFGAADRSWSEAFSEHLAVSFFPESGILAVPMNTWPRWDQEPVLLWDASFSVQPAPRTRYDLFVFQVDVTAGDDAIRLLGTIEHDSPVKRSLRIEDRLYSISRDTIRVHALLDPETELDSLYYLSRARDDRTEVWQGSEENAIDVLANDVIDVASESWSIEVDSPTLQGGSVVVDADRNVVWYTPPASFLGRDSFTYRLSTADGQWDEATVEVDVRISVEEDSQDNLLEVLAGLGSGADGSLLIIFAESATWGEEVPITEDGRGLLYSPAPNFYGTDRLRYEIRDVATGEISAGWLDVDVRNVNDDPHAEDDHYALDAGDPSYTLYPLRNDRFDPDPYERLVISEVGPTTGGGNVKIAPDGRTLLYTNDARQAVEDSFTYMVSDGNGGTAEATVTIDLRVSDRQRVIALAKLDLAERLGSQPGDVDVVSVKARNWPDGCLGLGGADQVCTQAIVPGYEVTLMHEGVQYVYRTDTSETVILAETDDLEPLVRIRLEAVGTDGAPLSGVAAGAPFNVNIYVDDLRDGGAGVFAAYVDIFYSGRLMQVDGEIAFDEEYRNGVGGSVLSSGLIDEVGAFAHLAELGGDERLLASIPFVALRGGLASLVLNPADEIGSEVLLYGLNEVIPWDQVELVGTEIEIEGTWTNVEEPTDVNDDGFTTALDALQCVNTLNSEGSRRLVGSEARAGASADPSLLVDVNGDFILSPEDALFVVNKLNNDAQNLSRQPVPVRHLAAWVDWQALEAEFQQGEWTPLGGVGLGTHEMLDLSHAIFAELDRDHVRDQVPADWVPRGVDAIHASLGAARQSSPIEPRIDRLVEAADDLQAGIDELDLQVVLPGVSANFDWDATREVFRDRFFARLSNAAFLDEVLE
jgi:uncharacterized secreted protein with C-terminal beta-propeller domain